MNNDTMSDTIDVIMNEKLKGFDMSIYDMLRDWILQNGDEPFYSVDKIIDQLKKTLDKTI
jgi:hypothetical protein